MPGGVRSYVDGFLGRELAPIGNMRDLPSEPKSHYAPPPGRGLISPVVYTLRAKSTTSGALATARGLPTRVHCP